MVRIAAPFTAGIQITNRCNLRCKYCYNASATDGMMSATDLQNVIVTLHARGVFKIHIEGGEPLLHPDWYSMVAFALDFYPDVTLLTNGTLIDRANADRISRLQVRSPRFSVQVSLDSHIPEVNDATRGMGANAIRGIDRLLSSNVRVQVASVLTSRNIDRIGELVDSLFPGVRTFHFMHMLPSALNRGCRELQPTKDMMYQFYRTIRDIRDRFGDDIILGGAAEEAGLGSAEKPPRRQCETLSVRSALGCEGFCLAGTTRIIITPSLDLLSCPISRQWMGNMAEASFEGIWYSDTAEAIRREERPRCRWQNEEPGGRLR